MRVPVILRPQAKADVRGIHASLGAVRAGLGDRFLKRLDQVIERVESMPLMYGLYWRSVRAVRLQQFRHVVYYIAFPDRTEVIGVVHGSQDQSVWQSRV